MKTCMFIKVIYNIACLLKILILVGYFFTEKPVWPYCCLGHTTSYGPVRYIQCNAQYLGTPANEQTFATLVHVHMYTVCTYIRIHVRR